MSSDRAKAGVNERYARIETVRYADVTLSESLLLRRVDKLRRGCVSGIDAITAEPVKWASQSKAIS